MIFIIWETVDIVTEHRFTYQEIIGFLVTNIVFTFLLTLEFLLKVCTCTINLIQDRDFENECFTPSVLLINRSLHSDVGAIGHQNGTVIIIIYIKIAMLEAYTQDEFLIDLLVMDAIVLIISIIEICLSITYLAQSKKEAEFQTAQADTEFLKFLRFVRVLRIIRILRLFRVSNTNNIG